MYSAMSTLSEYTHFYISKNITSYTFLLVFKIVESLQYILNLAWKEKHLFSINTLLFYKKPGSSLSPESCLYFQGFCVSKLLNGCLLV